MTNDGHGKPSPPAPGSGKARKRKGIGAYNDHDLDEYAAHTAEVKALAAGEDIVNLSAVALETRPPAFDRLELSVVRSWVNRRPLENFLPAAAMVDFPRMWTTNRGRYCHFKAPGGGNYALLRARPTF